MRSQALAWRDVLKMDDMQHDPPRLQVLGISLVKIGRKQYTLPELKDLLVDMKNEGLIEFDGLTGQQRKPRPGVTVRRTEKLENAVQN